MNSGWVRIIQTAIVRSYARARAGFAAARLQPTPFMRRRAVEIAREVRTMNRDRRLALRLGRPLLPGEYRRTDAERAWDL